ncbi:MAG: LCP family protein [Oscillibacter sp.]|jgi:LCP family protein required for cell wall assembly|nr:LCP family protein [Oscillibacter sp.]
MPRTRRRRRRRSSSHRGRTLLLVFILLAVTYACFRAFLRPPEQKTDEPGAVQSVSDNLPEGLSDEEAESLRSHYERKPSFYTVLVSGVDDGNGGSDTNILVAIDAENDYIYGVSIPRDTKAIINGKNRKINFAYNSGGMELLAQTVSGQLGIPVDYTVLVDLRGFEALVNTIGGVDFYIPVNMDYDDPLQDLSIHFPKGMRHLDGAEALKVVRFRHNNDGTGYGSEDIGRMQTQQNFLKAVAKKTLTVSNLTKLDSFVKIFHQYVETDLSLGNLAWLGAEAIGMGPEAIDFSTLPGDWKSPYIYLNQDEVLALVNQYLNPYVEDRLPEDLNIPS